MVASDLHDPGIPKMRLGLQPMRRLLARLDHPDRGISRIVHVAGTNGKGSVTAMLAAIYEAAGIPAAMFTSPHLGAAYESFRFRGRVMPANDFDRLSRTVRQAAADVASAGIPTPTPFECLTAMAYLWSCERGAEVLVQEVGLGGRLDATNAVSRTHYSIITDIALDHVQWLGGSEVDIAREKAGILRVGTPAVTAATGAALQVIREVAARKGIPLTIVARWDRATGTLPPSTYTVTDVVTSVTGGTRFTLQTPGEGAIGLRCRLLGSHQAINAAIAAVVARRMPLPSKEQAVSWDAVIRGLDAVHWPARLQLVQQDPPLVVDGAHNPAGMSALRRSLEELWPGATLVLLCGMLADKDLVGAARVWSGSNALVVTVPVPNPRSADPERLAKAFREAGLAHVYVSDSWPRGLRLARKLMNRLPSPVLCVCGSLFLAAAVNSGTPIPDDAT